MLCGSWPWRPGGCKDLRIPLPCPLVVKRGSNLAEGQTLEGMFAYRLANRHWRVQAGMARMGEEGTGTAATVLRLAAVVGWEQRRAEWVDVAWLAMRVHVGKVRGGGGRGATSLHQGGRCGRPTHPPRPKADSPRPSRRKSPPQSTPAEHAARERAGGGGGMWPNAWSNSSSSRSRGRSGGSAQRPPSGTWSQGEGGRKIPPGGEKICFQPRHLSPPNPVYKNFYPRGAFSTLTPHCPHWAHRPAP